MESQSSFNCSRVNLLLSCLHGTSGAIASSIYIICFYPFEKIRIKMQDDLKSRDLKQVQQLDYIETWQTVQKIYKEEGAKGFYKGVKSQWIASFFAMGFYFFFSQFFKRTLHIQPKNFLENAFVAFLSGSISTTITAPLWYINAQMAIQKDEITYFELIKKIYRQDGVRSFFRGATASIFLSVNPLLSYALYDYLKYHNRNSQNQQLITLSSAMISKLLATTVTYPYLFLRTNKYLMNSKMQKQSYLNMIKDIFHTQGIKGFYIGITAKLSSSVLNQVYTLYFYEQIKNILEDLFL